jgi:hypothetical protein
MVLDINRGENMSLIKKEWLQEMIFVDEYGRPYNLSDVPMTYMTRSESFKKQRFDRKKINKLYHEDLKDLKMVKEEVYG